MIYKVIKRDGQIVHFDARKVCEAAKKALVQSGMQQRGAVDISAIKEIATCCAESVVKMMDDFADKEKADKFSVEAIQDTVERSLMEQGEHEAAKAFILYRDKQARLRSMLDSVDPLSLNQYINVAKYAAYLPEHGRREIQSETIDRSREMHLNHFNHGAYNEAETLHGIINDSFDAVLDGLCMPSMRSMQFAGPAIEVNNARIYNCAFTLVNRARVFQEIFWCLLSGSGMGFSVRHRHIRHLPTVKKIDKDLVEHHEVEDTIEGWADALGALMTSYFKTGAFVEFSYVNIRRVGTLLKTSGGVAPGHVPLRELLEKLRRFLDAVSNTKLRAVQCLDIICHTAKAVLAGGIRRSSLICTFDMGDTEMLYCKSPGNFNLMPGYELNDQRRMANVSSALPRATTSRDEFERVMMIAAEGYGGEPGLAWEDDPDCGYNPCGEIGMDPRLLDDWEIYGDKSLDFDWKDYANAHMSGHYEWRRENSQDVLIEEGTATIPDMPALPEEIYGAGTGVQFCNLSETNVAACRTREEFLRAVRAAAAIGTLQAAYSDFHYLGPVTEAVVKRDALIGASLTGVFDRYEIGLNPELLQEGARAVVSMNKRVASLIGINIAARCTTVKPSGTASLALSGVTDDGRKYSPVASGAHPHHAERYFRRVTANRNEPAGKVFAKYNPHAVEVKSDGDLCLTFPVLAPAGCKTVKTMSAVEHADIVTLLNKYWIKPGYNRGAINHNVSCTVCFTPEEHDDLLTAMWENRASVGAMTIMPKTSDKLWPNAPREEVITEADESKWNDLVSNWTDVPWSEDGVTNEFDDGLHADTRSQVAACEGPLCEINLGDANGNS